jgi:DNA-binding NarL/FixJ family response regulator
MCIWKLNHKKENHKSRQLRVSLVIPFDLLRNGFSIMLSDLNHTVHTCYSNGAELISAITATDLPDVVLIDVDMPEAGVINTPAWLKEHYPSVIVVALSMEWKEPSIKQVLASGAAGYILKTISPNEMKFALKELVAKGYYFGPGYPHNF